LRTENVGGRGQAVPPLRQAPQQEGPAPEQAQGASPTAVHSLAQAHANPAQERKYFDSGDYALSKAGKAGDVGVTQVGREHPNPEKIPHIAPPTPTGGATAQNGNGQENKAGSPVKEHSFMHRETSLHRETSASDFDNEAQDASAKV
jgi:hypothetical protein